MKIEGWSIAKQSARKFHDDGRVSHLNKTWPDGLITAACHSDRRIGGMVTTIPLGNKCATCAKIETRLASK